MGDPVFSNDAAYRRWKKGQQVVKERHISIRISVIDGKFFTNASLREDGVDTSFVCSTEQPDIHLSLASVMPEVLGYASRLFDDQKTERPACGICLDQGRLVNQAIQGDDEWDYCSCLIGQLLRDADIDAELKLREHPSSAAFLSA